MQIYLEKSFLDTNIQDTSEKFDLDLIFNSPSDSHYFIYDSNGLSFIKDSNNPKEMLNVNFLSGKLGWRIKRADHEGNLKKALGKTKERFNIFDATAGLLSDSMIFLSLGHNVVAVEQSKIIYLLVNDAIHRARNKKLLLKNLKFIHGNSIVSYKKSKKSFDIIYLDPMYPVTKKKIKKSGDLRSIGSILELENLFDKGDYLIDQFMKVDCKKLILKRPLKSETTYSNINYQVKGKTTRFDIYL